jgi:hypothetical protein
MSGSLTEIATQITQLEDYRTHNLQDDLSRAQQRDANPKFITQVMDKYRAYKNINLELSKVIHNSTPPDLGQRLSQIGSDQQKIAHLKKEIRQAKTDLQTAQERDQQIKLDPPQVSEYQGVSKYFGIVKPLHFVSVALLLGSALFIFIVTALLVKDNFLTGVVISTSGLGSPTLSTNFVKDPRVWATLFGASLVVILFLSLKIANKLPTLPA